MSKKETGKSFGFFSTMKWCEMEGLKIVASVQLCWEGAISGPIRVTFMDSTRLFFAQHANFFALSC